MRYFIRVNPGYGFDTVDHSGSNLAERRAELETQGYREATDLEYRVARLLSDHHPDTARRVVDALFKEMSEPANN